MSDYEEDATQITEWNDEGQITPKDALSFVGNLINSAIEIQKIGLESKRIDCEMEKYRMMRDIAITQITKNAEFNEALMNKSFEERRMVIEKQFKVIDEGLENKNYELVNLGLQHILATVKDNPFKLYQITTASQRHTMLEDGELSIE